VLRYPPTRTEIECVYVDELEETMIENRRGPIQATGQFTLDDEGNPTKLTNVTQLEPVDLSPISLKRVSWQGREFRFRQPLILQPNLDESSQYYVVESPDLTLLAYAPTREQLLQEIAEQIAFMWDAYVNESEDQLAPDALRLRQRLSEDVLEISKDAA
jgi:predicted RNase H-like HicB family nuclease